MNLTSDAKLNFSHSYGLLNSTSGNGTTRDVQSPLYIVMNKSIIYIPIIILFITMISMGCTMEITKIKSHIIRPKGICIALVAQFGIMPLTAFSLAKILQLGTFEAIAVIICGCCPGGNLSNIFALALQGDTNLSIVMTSCSTVVALGAMPLLLYLYCQGFSGVESAVPYLNIFLSLVLTLVPCAIGIAIKHWAPRYTKLTIKVGLGILLIASVSYGVISAFMLGPTVWQVFTPQLITVAFLMPFIGFLLGYTLSVIFRHNGKCSRTIAMETGCQNIQLCSAILNVLFPPEVIGPLFAFPLLYFIFQIAEALLYIFLFRIHKRYKSTTKEDSKHLEVDNPSAEVKGQVEEENNIIAGSRIFDCC